MALRIIAGTAAGRPLLTPRGLKVRPTAERVRSALFSIVGGAVQGARVLDLYAGTGALGLEALSRGALLADFVESSPRLCSLIRANIVSLGFQGRARVVCRRVERALALLEGPYHLALADPPYEAWPLEGLLQRLGEAPLLAPGALLVLEHSARHRPGERYGDLALWQCRRYGDTCLSFYRRGKGKNNGDSPVPGEF